MECKRIFKPVSYFLIPTHFSIENKNEHPKLEFQRSVKRTSTSILEITLKHGIRKRHCQTELFKEL